MLSNNENELKKPVLIFLITILVLSAITYLLVSRRYYPGYFNDDAAYILGAESIVKYGKFLNLTTPPKYPQTHYSIGMPFLLAPFTLLFKKSYPFYKLIPIILTLVSSGILFMLFRKHLSESQALFLISLFAFCPITVLHSNYIMTEPLFLFLTYAYILLVYRTDKLTLKNFVPQLVLLAYILTVRMDGLALAGAHAFLLWKKKDIKNLLLLTSVSLLISVFFLSGSFKSTHQSSTYISQFIEYYSLGFRAKSLTIFLTPLKQIKFLLFTVIPYYMFYWPKLLGGAAIKYLVIFASVLLLLTGLAANTKEQKDSIIVTYFIFYLLIHLLWPFTSVRFYLALLPLVFYFLIAGWNRIKNKSAFLKKIQIPLASLTIITYMLPVALLLKSPADTTGREFNPPYDTYAWMKKNTEANSITASYYPYRDFLYSRRYATSMPTAKTPYTFLKSLDSKGAGHILIDKTMSLSSSETNLLSWDNIAPQTIIGLLKASPAYKAAYENKKEKTRVFAKTASMSRIQAVYGFSKNARALTNKNFEEIVGLLKDHGINAVFANPEEKLFIKKLRQAGIMVFVDVSIFVGDKNWLNYPGSRPINSNGEKIKKIDWYAGVCPNNKHVRTKNLKRIEKVLREGGIDGLWLDFIRYPCYWETKDPKLEETCFCGTCLKKFQCRMNVVLPDDLKKTSEKAKWILKNHRLKWERWKCANITTFVKNVKSLIDDYNSPVMLGVFVVPWKDPDFDGAITKILGQDIKELSQYADIFSPMAYHKMCGKAPKWIEEITYASFRHTHKPVLPIIQAFNEPSNITNKEFKEAVIYGSSYYSSGLIIFKWSDLIKNERLKVLNKNQKE